MTIEERNRIFDLKNKGFGYKKISTILGLSIGSIRNVLAEDSSHCVQCAKKLIFIKGKKRKKFCSDACRYNYWNDRKKYGL